MLPIWPRTYSALAIDVDHRVREGVQVAHGTLVKKVGKNIAVYLKQLAGPWFVSQYDQYPPAASAATNCFNVRLLILKDSNLSFQCIKYAM